MQIPRRMNIKNTQYCVTFDEIEISHKSGFFSENTYFLHACETGFELPSNVSNMICEIPTY